MTEIRDEYSSRILWYSCVAHALTHVYTNLHPVLLVTIALSFGSNQTWLAYAFHPGLEPLTLSYYEGAAVCFTVMNVFFGCGSIPAGWLGDRLGEKVLLLTFFVGCAVGGIVISAADSVWVLGIGALLLGCARSIYHPVGTALISKGLRQRGRAMGIAGIAGSVGTALGPVVGGTVAFYLTWRWSYLLLAIPTVVFGVALAMTDLGPAARPIRTQRPVPLEGREAGDGDSKIGRPLLVLFLILLSAMTLGGFYFHLFTTTLPPLLSAVSLKEALTRDGGFFGGDALKAGLVSGLVLLCGAFGQYKAGIFCDRYDKRKLYVLNYLIIVPLVFFLGRTEGTATVALACVSTVFFFAVQPIENTLIADFTPARWRGAVYGAKFILVFGVGGTGTLVAASLLKHYSTTAVFNVATVVSALALVCAAVAWRIQVPVADPAGTDPPEYTT